jgi:hypothetical protein
MKLMIIGLAIVFAIVGIGAHLAAERIAGAMDDSANRIAAARGN